MNGCAFAQSLINGQWETIYEADAGERLPAIYQLDQAIPAPLDKIITGSIVHISEETIYQEAGRAHLFAHALDAFPKRARGVREGQLMVVKYTGHVGDIIDYNVYQAARAPRSDD